MLFVISLPRGRLLQAAAVAFFLGLPGCRRAPDAAPVVISSPFDAMRLIRESVRRSPDHFAVVARSLVARKDVEALHLFVRDQIRTLPDDETGFVAPVRTMRWGTRAALRYGAGTPREKAELLAELYREAGLEAVVVVGRVALADSGPLALLRGSTRAAFAPTFAPGEEAALAAALNVPARVPRVVPLDPDDQGAAALAAQLAKLAEDALGTGAFAASRRSIELPLVRVLTPAGERLANPNVPGAAFSAPQIIGKPSAAPAPLPTPPVRIAIHMTRTSAPDELIELVSAEWAADELAGRQVIVGFAPPVSADRLLTMRVNEVRAVVPMLALRGADLPAAAVALQTRTGRAITLGGDVIDIGSDGAVRVNDEQVADAEGDATLVARVSSLEVGARSVAFPSVSLTVTARDATGAVVDGLPASALLVQDGAPVVASLTRNRRAPRVLLLLDGSRSLPAAFRDRGAVEFARAVAERLLADDPTLRLRVRAVGETPAAEPWLADATEVEASARRHLPKSFESGLWRTMSLARTAADPTVVVLVTDGAATDQPRADYMARIVAGPPAVVIGVGSPDVKTLTALAKAAGGETATASNPEAAVQAIQRLVATRTAAAHRLSYDAPADATGERTVRVELAGRGISATATYTVPAMAERVLSDAVAGLYVSVQLGRDRYLRPLVEGAADEVEAALFGTALLTFEGDAPTPSAWIDDVLTGMLAQEPLLRAMAASDRKAVVAELAKAPYGVAPEVFSFFPQLQRAGDTEMVTFGQGLSAVLTTSRRRPNRPGVRRVDVLPMLRVATVGADARARTQRTLERTARLALTEQARYATSTASLLAGKALAVVPAGRKVGSVLKGADAKALATLALVADDPVWRTRVRFVAQDASTAAFWAVTPRNGTLIGVLPDGSGGGEVEEINAVFNRATTVLNNIGVAASAFGASFGFGAWLSLEQTKLTKLHAATLTLATMEVQPGDITAPGELPCAIATGAIGPVLGAVGAKAAEKVVGWLGTFDAGMSSWGGGGICSRL